MELQYYALVFLLIWLQLAAVTAFIGAHLKSWVLGRSIGVLLVVVVAFFIEHFIGLGSLGWGWVLSIPAAIYLWRKWPELKNAGFIRSEAVFIAAFAYGMIWKYLLPAIYPTAERLTDMVFVGNYYSGSMLPPIDNWYPPYKFDFYYGLQHYGAALMGRMFRLTPGLATNLGFVLLMALPLTLAWEVAGRFVKSWAPKFLLVAALGVGGTGASMFTALIYQQQGELTPQAKSSVVNGRMWGSARFIGHYDQLANTDIGLKWIPKKDEEGSLFRDLPMENFGYQYFIGDYHPPIGGFFLLILAITLITSIEIPRPNEDKRITHVKSALLGMTVPITIATNTWVFPLHGAMVGGWALWRQFRSAAMKVPSEQAPAETGEGVAWKALIGGGVAGFVLLYPYLVGFTDRSSSTPLSLVQSHTPLIPFLMQMWPMLIMMGLAIFDKGTRRPAMYFGLLFAGLMLFTEFFFIDDPSVREFQRTNSVMKWWGWIWTGALVALGAPLLGSQRLWVRGATSVALAGTMVYLIHTIDYLADVDWGRRGKLKGDTVYTEVPVVKEMFRYLAEAPNGIVLENQYTEAYHDGGAYAAFAAKPLLLGWPAHIVTWRGRVMEAMERRDQIRAFYAGNLSDPVQWLTARNVRYVVWNPRDAESAPGVLDRLKPALDSAYAWHFFGYSGGGQPVGLWVRRDSK